MKKKILAVFLSLCMAMSLLPVTALAAEAADEKTPSAQATTLPEADENGVITLENDVTLSASYQVEGKLTVNLNNHKITGPSSTYAFSVKNGATLTIDGEGTIDGYAAAQVTGNLTPNGEAQPATLIVNGGTLTGSELGILYGGNGAKVVINGGVISGGDNAGIMSNGTKNSTTDYGGSVLEVNDGTIIGYTKSVEAGWRNCAIYLPQNGTTTINGGTIKGNNGAGIVLRAGDLTINEGATIEGHGTGGENCKMGDANPTYCGGLEIGYSCNYPGGIGDIVINGGTFTSEKSDAVKVIGSADQSTVEASKNSTITISGGTFSTRPNEDYIATGYAATKNDAGKYVVGHKDGGALEVKPSTDSGKTSATLEGIYAGPSTEVEKPSTGAGSGTEGIAGTDVTVDLSSTGSTTTTGTVELTVNADTAKSLVSANAEALTVKSDVGTVKLDSAALGELKDVSEAVVISIAATNDEGTAPTWEVTITSGSTKIFDEANNPAGTIEISVPAPAGASDNTKVYCIDNGMEDMRAVYNEDENTLAWTTEHLSTFAALDASQEASWTTANSTSGSGTLQAALEAVDEVGGTIVVNKSATLSNANFTIKKDVTIQGTGVITATVTNEKQHAFTVAPNSTLTLDGITLKIDGNTGYGFDVQYDATLTLNNHAIVDISNISNATISSKPQGATNPGKINVNNSVITANNIRGNFSNGGVWTIGTGSEVTIDTCQSHGFSASAIIVENGATVDIKNVAYRGISINDAKGKLEIQAGGVVNVTNAGTADDPTTPRDAVYLDAKATEGLIVKAGATLNVTAGKDGNDRIELSTEAVSKSELNGTIIGTVDLPEGASHWVVTYKDNGKNWKVELVAKNSATITLPEIPDQGYNHFQGWTDQNGKHYEGRQEVTISSNMTFTAVWTYIPPANPNYRIDIPAAEGGTVTADPAAAKAGAKVTLTATPDEGYAVGTITVTDRFGDAVKVTENADGTYTFTMPNGQVTVKATFVETEEPAPAMPFTDVHEGDWFYEEVLYAYENGLMNGVGDNRFAPNSATTRGMLVTILYRLEGEPAVTGEAGFDDVAAGQWYTDAVIWAAANDIVNGIGDNQFGPENTLTREQLVTMLYRYAQNKGYDVTASADLSGYPDAGQIQSWAQEAMTWAVAEGIVEGMDGNLNPAGNATRAQIATILMRFCEGVAK